MRTPGVVTRIDLGNELLKLVLASAAPAPPDVVNANGDELPATEGHNGRPPL